MSPSRILACAGLALLATVGRTQFDSGHRAVEKGGLSPLDSRLLMGDPGLLRAAARVSTKKPLNAAQATILANAYFSMRTGDCGILDAPADRGTYWSFPTLMGVAARRGEIKVAKATGRTSMKDFVVVARPQDFAKYIRVERPHAAERGG